MKVIITEPDSSHENGKLVTFEVAGKLASGRLVLIDPRNDIYVSNPRGDEFTVDRFDIVEEEDVAGLRAALKSYLDAKASFEKAEKKFDDLLSKLPVPKVANIVKPKAFEQVGMFEVSNPMIGAWEVKL